MANRNPNIGLASGLRKSTSMPIPNAANAAYYSDVARNDAEHRNNIGSVSQLWWPYPKNLNDVPNTIPEAQYAATKWNEASSAIGNEQAQEGFSNLMSTRGEGDPRSNERYQQLLARRDDIVAEIHRLMSEISWQETLKARNLSQDPLWEEAKYNWIYKGDDSGMKNIRDIEVKRKSDEEQRYWQAQENRKQRESTENLAKLNRDKELSDKKEANERSAKSARDRLVWAFDNYKVNPADTSILNDLFESFQKYKEAAEVAGLDPKNFMYDTRFDEIESSLDSGLKTKKANIEASKAKTELEKKITVEVNSFNDNTGNKNNASALNAKLTELKQKYPNYRFFSKGGGKIDFTLKTKK